jgi:hypothetical protein
MPAMQEALSKFRRVYFEELTTFFTPLLTAKPPAFIHYPAILGPDGLFTVIWLRPLSTFVIAALPTSHVVSTPDSSLDVQPNPQFEYAPIFTVH